MMPGAVWAAELSESLLSSLGDRWRHVQGVARRAVEIADAVPEWDRPVLVAAAWLHDIGYGPAVRCTGFHPLDGARYLESQGVDRRLCCLVAHHSAALVEAEERGLVDELGAFELEDGPVLDALVYADMTTGPQGQRLTFDQRIEEILSRYGEGTVVHRAILRARPVLAGAVERTERRLAGCRG
ncbi:Metal dependent phosphohydrolase [Carbonactinospora thermoautotrophica]|uniref:Metal dependent phosphohydrolase n=1 Tax=Carbonactinospora thermoautotrophica TaxID=1469144 RepID=A0A132MLS8_9ACTN|nr:Metal dependent phosphohydrolase [Carbonactinospora thermoautotrophica]